MRRLTVGLVSVMFVAAGGVLFPSPLGLFLIAIGAIGNGMLISAMSAGVADYERRFVGLVKLAGEFYEMGKESSSFGIAANRLMRVLRGDEQS